MGDYTNPGLLEDFQNSKSKYHELSHASKINSQIKTQGFEHAHDSSGQFTKKQQPHSYDFSDHQASRFSAQNVPFNQGEQYSQRQNLEKSSEDLFSKFDDESDKEYYQKIIEEELLKSKNPSQNSGVNNLNFYHE